jgi:hypothetical protein
MIRVILIIVAVVGIAIYLFIRNHTDNLLVSPNDHAKWTWMQGTLVSAGLSDDQGGLRFDIKQTNNNVGDLELSKLDVVLKAGQAYHLTFKARALEPHKVWLYASHGGMNGYQTTMGLATDVNVSTEWKDYDFGFTATNADGKKDRAPVFALGDAPGTVWIKDISLTEGG